MAEDTATCMSITRTFKRIALIFTPFIFVLFTACGGGDDAPPTAPTSSPLAPGTEGNKQHMEELIKKLLSGQEKSCGDEGLKALLLIALKKKGEGAPGGLSAFANPSAGGFGGGAGYGAPPSGGFGNGALGNLGAGCADILNQIIWNATRIKYKNGQPWINEVASKLWLAKKLGKFLNQIGDRAGPGLASLGIGPGNILSRLGPEIRAFIDQSIIGRLGGPVSRIREALAQHDAGGFRPTLGGSFGYDEDLRNDPFLATPPRPPPRFPGGLPPDILPSLPP